MAYQVDKFNGQFFVSVEDGTIDTTSDLRLVGKNYAGYGELQNENFLHLLESFANTTPPPKSIIGQIWYDTTSTVKKLKYYDGTQWKVAGSAEVSPTEPNGLTVGDFWWDTTTSQLKAWNGIDFTLIGPESSPNLGTSTISASVVKGTISTDVGPHTILKVFADNKVVGVFSRTPFTLDSENPIEDFSLIKKGFTLAGTNNADGVSSNDFVMWGTASNALRLGGIAASQYLRVGDNSFTGEVSFDDPGFTVGNDSDLRIYIDPIDGAVIENKLGSEITVKITVAETTDERNVAVFTRTGLNPGNNNSYSIGTSDTRWNNIFSTTVTGNLIGNVTGNTTGVHTGNVLASDNTVIIDATTKQIGFTGANIFGTLFGSVTGSSTSATNAQKLGNLDPLSSVPPGGTASIPIRDATGNITANQFIGISSNTDRTRINNSAVDPTISSGTPISSAPIADQYRTAMTTQTAWTIAARDGDANITANIFNGTATAARYADLAEKYLADQNYEVGTVVAVGGQAEVTACQYGDRAIGVVSANPAYMMNSELEGGTYIALKGRVPVRISGTVKKGDRLTAGDNGTAVVTKECKDVFAVALESNEDSGIKIIEALVL
jgi:hypothetical protein